MPVAQTDRPGPEQRDQDARPPWWRLGPKYEELVQEAGYISDLLDGQVRDGGALFPSRPIRAERSLWCLWACGHTQASCVRACYRACVRGDRLTIGQPFFGM